MDLDTFSEIFFGIIATVLGIIALWFAYKYREGKQTRLRLEELSNQFAAQT